MKEGLKDHGFKLGAAIKLEQDTLEAVARVLHSLWGISKLP